MEKGVFVGDNITVNMHLNDYFKRLRPQYNEFAEKNDLETFPEFTHVYYTYGDPHYTEFSCKIKATFDKTYGKMPVADSELQIIMEYEYYAALMAESTTFDDRYISWIQADEFKEWQLSIEDLAYHHTD